MIRSSEDILITWLLYINKAKWSCWSIVTQVYHSHTALARIFCSDVSWYFSGGCRDIPRSSSKEEETSLEVSDRDTFGFCFQQAFADQKTQLTYLSPIYHKMTHMFSIACVALREVFVYAYWGATRNLRGAIEHTPIFVAWNSKCKNTQSKFHDSTLCLFTYDHIGTFNSNTQSSKGYMIYFEVFLSN